MKRTIGSGLVFMALAACATSATSTTAAPTTLPPTTAPPTTVAAPSSTGPVDTSAPVTTAGSPLAFETLTYLDGVETDIYRPGGDPRGVVVIVHGGAWVGGDRLGLGPLAEEIVGDGYLTFNTTYRTSDGSYPTTFEDVACSVRFARQTAADEYEAGLPLTVIGHSAGAHIGALISLGGESFSGDCPWDGEVLPEGLIGLAGPYDITRMAFLDFLDPFFGAAYADDPTNWDASNPYSYIGENPGLQVSLLHGEADDEVPLDFSEDFEFALNDSGYTAVLETFPNVDHFEIFDPDVVGETISQFLATVG